MKRDVLPDVLKGFGAVLVVLGHCIQMNCNAFFEDELYQFIYSFHMPLFMVISGYYWSCCSGNGSFQRNASVNP